MAAEQSTIVIQVNDATTGVSLVRKIVVGQFIWCLGHLKMINFKEVNRKTSACSVQICVQTSVTSCTNRRSSNTLSLYVIMIISFPFFCILLCNKVVSTDHI